MPCYSSGGTPVHLCNYCNYLTVVIATNSFKRLLKKFQHVIPSSSPLVQSTLPSQIFLKGTQISPHSKWGPKQFPGFEEFPICSKKISSRLNSFNITVANMGINLRTHCFTSSGNSLNSPWCSLNSLLFYEVNIEFYYYWGLFYYLPSCLRHSIPRLVKLWL